MLALNCCLVVLKFSFIFSRSFFAFVCASIFFFLAFLPPQKTLLMDYPVYFLPYSSPFSNFEYVVQFKINFNISSLSSSLKLDNVVDKDGSDYDIPEGTAIL